MCSLPVLGQMLSKVEDYPRSLTNYLIVSHGELFKKLHSFVTEISQNILKKIILMSTESL